jgi:flagellar hook-basal body complex protein FliE
MNPTQVTNAYAAMQGLGSGGQSSLPSAVDKGFSDILQTALDETAKIGDTADNKITEMASGKANVVDVVTAVAETEVAVQTLVTVRDKVIAAYKEVMNMPI